MVSQQKRKRVQRQKQTRKRKQKQRQSEFFITEALAMHDVVPEQDQESQRAVDGRLWRILPQATRLSSRWKTITASYIIKDAFRLHTLLTIGAAMQIALCACVRQPWCYVPAAALLLWSLATTTCQIVLPHLPPFLKFGRLQAFYANTYLTGAVLGRSTALAALAGNKTNARGGGEVVVFHFGARFNHPLGLLAPGGPAMTKLFLATIAALEDDRTNKTNKTNKTTNSNYGLIGASLFRGGERASNDTIFLVLYFDSVSGLQRFAQSPVHKQAYHWLDGNRRHYPHLSAFHETFCVPAGCFETLYINTAPILLGNTYVRRRTDGDGNVWINSLVDAGDARLQTMKARMQYQTMF